ncbi:uncharacterized protein LOC129584022 isoform X2 [Paramacrobiotus metropolitanus]|nr:uncharacterized protein LOC129584022 isoform X2 [Paramacrobiotus metropolitanus]
MKPLSYFLGLKVEVEAREATKITASECSCRAGGGNGTNALCKHIFALVYALRIVVDGGPIPMWRSALPVTSMEQQWGVPSLRSRCSELLPGRADLYAAFMRPELRHKWKPRLESRIHPAHRQISSEEMREIRNALSNTKIFPKHLLRLLEEESVNLRLPRSTSPDLTNPFVDHSVWDVTVPALPLRENVLSRKFSESFLPHLSTETGKFYFETVHIDYNKCVVVENSTRLQSKCTEWNYHRSLRVTSSNTKVICTAMQRNTEDKEDRLKKLALAQISPKSVSHIPAIRRGNELEDEAVEMFCKLASSNMTTVCNFRVGFCIHPAEPWIGASPDRLIRETDESTGEVTWALLEVKTFDPKKEPFQLRYIVDDGNGCFMLKRSHAHYYQVQIAMACTGLRNCYFFAYANAGKDYFLEKVPFSEDAVEFIFANCTEFYFNKYLPAFVSSKNM